MSIHLFIRNFGTSENLRTATLSVTLVVSLFFMTFACFGNQGAGDLIDVLFIHSAGFVGTPCYAKGFWPMDFIIKASGLEWSKYFLLCLVFVCHQILKYASVVPGEAFNGLMSS